MTKTCLLIATLLFSFCATAKEHAAHHGLVQSRSAMPVSGKTTAIEERLTGYSYRHIGSSTLLDTMGYKYSGARGSGHIDWGSDIIPTVYVPNFQKIKCDSFLNKVDAYNYGMFYYNSSDEAVEYIYNDSTGSGTGTLIPRDHLYFYYNGSNQIALDSEYYYPYSSIYKNFHTYDAGGHVTEDSAYNYTANVPSWKRLYTYDGSGNNTSWVYYNWSSGWVPYEQVFYTYDSYNRQTTDLVQYYTSGAWANSSKDSSYYPGSSSRYTYESYYTSTSGAWVGTGANSFHVNASDQWDTIYYYNWDAGTSAFAPVERDYQIYDAYGNVQYSGGFQYSTATSSYATVPYDINTYYYETYDAVSVTTVPTTRVTVDMFPNPVSQKLYISVQDMNIQEDADVRIADLLGRQLGTGKVSSRATTVIDMGKYPAGTYIVSVMGSDVNYSHKIVKSE